MKADTDQRLMLATVTVEQDNAATSVIADHARNRAELVAFMQMIAPAPHNPDTTPSRRRATPRTTR